MCLDHSRQYLDVSRYRKLVKCSRRKVFKWVPKTKTETFNEFRHLAEQKDELIRSVERDIVMIAREADLRLLSGANLTLFADRTFQYSPKHFKQMLTIFTLSNRYYIPVCHFLLQNKLFTTYKKSLEMLANECSRLSIDLNVANIMLDFEAGLIKAFRKTFPTANIQGCRFHLGQSWWRTIGKLGLAAAYKSAHTRDGRWLRRCFGLQLLPAHLVKTVFEKAVRLAKPDKATPFADYLRKSYIIDDSPFPSSTWAGLTGKRTNNGAESFNRHFGDLFGYLHTKPNIWQFCRTMKLYNIIKDTKMVSSKTLKEISDFWTVNIDAYVSKKISVIKLLDKLSLKCQPKTKSKMRK